MVPGQHVDDRVERAGDEVRELELHDRPQAHQCGTRGQSGEPGLGDRRVDHPSRPELLQEALRDLECAAESTERASEIGDGRWRGLLERHHEAIRAQLERGGGTEVKTLGDGFLATFDGPAQAIRCANTIHEATATLGLPLRIGLHCGEIEVMDDDIGGIAVHIAARVGALAGPGEVLVSRTVKDLVAGSGIAFETRGTHTLKGIPDEWELLAVVT